MLQYGWHSNQAGIYRRGTLQMQHFLPLAEALERFHQSKTVINSWVTVATTDQVVIICSLLPIGAMMGWYELQHVEGHDAAFHRLREEAGCHPSADRYDPDVHSFHCQLAAHAA
jgi:hypothetical protein